MITDNEERGIKDRLDFFYAEKFEVHITLKRILKNGNHSWLNGYLTPTNSDRVWTIEDRVLGAVRVAISEIDCVEEVKE